MEIKNKNSEKKQALGLFLNRHAGQLALCMMVVAAMSASFCFASGADALWGQISNLIQTWVTRLGGVLMFVGGVMFGLGWKSEDANQKSNGISTIIAGAIVIAVAQLTGTFFA